MRKNLPKCVRTLIVPAVLLAISGGLARAEGIQGLSKPSQDVTLMCARPGQIAKVEVQEGDKVKADQLLVQEDDRAEKIAAEAAKAKADDVTKVEAQKALLDQSRIDFQRSDWGFQRGAVNPLEHDKARIDVVVAEAQLKVAQFDKDQAKLESQKADVDVEKMTIRSPFDGFVAQKFVSPGESVELNTKVVRVVKVDPLWVEVNVPFTKARTIKTDSAATINFTDKSTATGKVIVVSPVADAAARTIMVRLEVPNPDARQPGEQVSVDFSEPQNQAAAK